MQPYNHPITIYRGDYFSETFRLRSRVWNQVLNNGQGGWEPGPYYDLTGWTGLFQIRANEDDTAVLAQGTVTIPTDPLLRGMVQYSLSGTDTQSLVPAAPGSALKYDVQLTDNQGNPRTYLFGIVTVIKDVSRV